MPYTVVSGPGADDELALIWLQASDPTAVTKAANDIEQLLQTAPLKRGTALNGSYGLVVWPLSVIYEVDLKKQLVTIWKFIYQG